MFHSITSFPCLCLSSFKHICFVTRLHGWPLSWAPLPHVMATCMPLTHTHLHTHAPASLMLFTLLFLSTRSADAFVAAHLCATCLLQWDNLTTLNNTPITVIIIDIVALSAQVPPGFTATNTCVARDDDTARYALPLTTATHPSHAHSLLTNATSSDSISYGTSSPSYVASYQTSIQSSSVVSTSTALSCRSQATDSSSFAVTTPGYSATNPSYGSSRCVTSAAGASYDSRLVSDRRAGRYGFSVNGADKLLLLIGLSSCLWGFFIVLMRVTF